MSNGLPVIERKPTQSALVGYQAAREHRVPRKEIIVLQAAGADYTDWTSVRVEVRPAELEVTLSI